MKFHHLLDEIASKGGAHWVGFLTTTSMTVDVTMIYGYLKSFSCEGRVMYHSSGAAAADKQVACGAAWYMPPTG